MVRLPMTTTSPLRLFRLLAAVVLVVQLAFAQAMAADSELHHRCHDHAHDPGHECVVTLILNGGYDMAVPDIRPVDLPATPPLVSLILPNRTAVLPSHQAGGLMAHAPPRGP